MEANSLKVNQTKISDISLESIIGLLFLSHVIVDELQLYPVEHWEFDKQDDIGIELVVVANNKYEVMIFNKFKDVILYQILKNK